MAKRFGLTLGLAFAAWLASPGLTGFQQPTRVEASVKIASAADPLDITQRACLSGDVEGALWLVQNHDDPQQLVHRLFQAVHPIADQGKDEEVAGCMAVVVAHQPKNYQALYHLGMGKASTQPEQAEQHLQAFLDIYHRDDGWRRNALDKLVELNAGEY